jgi:hypothetical protein
MNDHPAAPAVPGRLAPFLAQWDYVVEVLTDPLAGMTDAEYLWQPAAESWTVRPNPAGGRSLVDTEVWAPTGDAAPPRTIAWRWAMRDLYAASRPPAATPV